MEETVLHCKAILEGIGLKVAKIDEVHGSRTADLFAEDEKHEYIIEVTSKQEIPFHAKELKETGSTYISEKYERKSRLIGKFRDKANQLEQTKGGDDVIRLVWIYMEGLNPETQMEQCEATLMGKVTLLYSKNEEDCSTSCYYFDYGDFYKRKHLDGVIMSTKKYGRLLVNHEGNNVKRLRGARIYNHFSKTSSVADPLVNLPKGCFVAHDFEGNRKDERAIEGFLKTKYSLDVAGALRMNSFTGVVFVPDNILPSAKEEKN
jgi:hypothetical protein